MIEPILEAEGVPDDMKYLCVIESGMSQVLVLQGHLDLAVYEKDSSRIRTRGKLYC